MSFKRAFSRLRNEKGMGIVQTLILAGVSAALIAAISSALLNMYKSQATVSQSLEATLFMDQLQQVLADDSICSAKMTPFLAKLNGANQDLAFHLPMSTGDVYMNRDTPISDNLVIDGVSSRIDMSVAPQTLVSGATTVRHFQSILSIQLRKRNSNSFVQSMKPVEIPMHLIVNQSDQAIACAATSDGSKACLAQGGTWNPLAVDGQKCIALQYCQYGGSWAEAADTDGGFINSLTGGRSCPAGFASQQSGTISKAQSNGKYSVSNSSSRIFTCMRCGGQLAAQTAAVPSKLPVPMADMNQEAYNAVAETDANNYNLAASDTEIAYRNWQDGVKQANQLDTLITQSNSAQQTASQNLANAQALYQTSQNDYAQASAKLSAAQAAYSSNASGPNAQAVADAQNLVNTAATNRTNAANSVTFYQQQKDQSATAAANYNAQKKTVDANNASLYQKYIQAKAISDNLQQIAAASRAAADAGREPAQ